MRHKGGRNVAGLQFTQRSEPINNASLPDAGRVKRRVFGRQDCKCRQPRDIKHSRKFASVTALAKVAGEMHAEHVVGESVVVPGLKLIDHTFQVT